MHFPRKTYTHTYIHTNMSTPSPTEHCDRHKLMLRFGALPPPASVSSAIVKPTFCETARQRAFWTQEPAYVRVLRLYRQIQYASTHNSSSTSNNTSGNFRVVQRWHARNLSNARIFRATRKCYDIIRYYCGSSTLAAGSSSSNSSSSETQRQMHSRTS